jgi:hypothetical protein
MEQRMNETLSTLNPIKLYKTTLNNRVWFCKYKNEIDGGAIYNASVKYYTFFYPWFAAKIIFDKTIRTMEEFGIQGALIIFYRDSLRIQWELPNKGNVHKFFDDVDKVLGVKAIKAKKFIYGKAFWNTTLPQTYLKGFLGRIETIIDDDAHHGQVYVDYKGKTYTFNFTLDGYTIEDKAKITEGEHKDKEMNPNLKE